MSQSCKVWLKFSSKIAGGEILKFRITDMPDDRYQDVTDLVQRYFHTESPFCRASGLPESVCAMKEAGERLKRMFDAKLLRVTVCCIDDGTENVHEIIGASLMMIATKHDAPEDFKPQTKEMKKYLEITSDLYSKFDALKTYGLDNFYKDRLVVVHPKYRRLGIARKFFEVRRLMCKEHSVPLTGAWMMSLGSQKAAEQDGWETPYEVTYKDLDKQYGVAFKDVPPTCKYMIGRPE